MKSRGKNRPHAFTVLQYPIVIFLINNWYPPSSDIGVAIVAVRDEGESSGSDVSSEEEELNHCEEGPGVISTRARESRGDAIENEGEDDGGEGQDLEREVKRADHKAGRPGREAHPEEQRGKSKLNTAITVARVAHLGRFESGEE